jgi:hypothetical protein
MKMIRIGILAETEERTVLDAEGARLLFATSLNTAAPCPSSSSTIPFLAFS